MDIVEVNRHTVEKRLHTLASFSARLAALKVKLDKNVKLDSSFPWPLETAHAWFRPFNIGRVRRGMSTIPPTRRTAQTHKSQSLHDGSAAGGLTPVGSRVVAPERGNRNPGRFTRTLHTRAAPLPTEPVYMRRLLRTRPCMTNPGWDATRPQRSGVVGKGEE
jgi:hypothetical protein